MNCYCRKLEPRGQEHIDWVTNKLPQNLIQLELGCTSKDRNVSQCYIDFKVPLGKTVEIEVF